MGELSVAKEARHGVPYDSRCTQEGERNHQTDAASPKEFAQPPSRLHGPLGEVLVDRLAKHLGLIGLSGASLEMDHQRQACVTRQIPRPFNDELLRSRIEIAIAKRRGIDGVEELAEFGDADFDNPALRRNCIPGG